MGQVYYIPTEEEKEMLSKKCNEVIDLLSDLCIEQKALVLEQLIRGFQDVSGISVIALLEEDKEGVA